METNNQTTLASIQEEIKRKKARKKRRRFRAWLKITALLILLALVIFVVVKYEQSSYSKVSLVTIKNNRYVDDQEILSYSKLEVGDRIYLKLGMLIENDLNKHPFIETSTIKVDYLHQSVSIWVEETTFIGYLTDNNETFLLSKAGEMLPITDLSLIADLPHIRGYTAEMMPELVKFLNRIDSSVYGLISEMRRAPASYDETQVELLMSDGIIVTSPINGLELLTSENYYGVINRLDSDKRCILIDPYTQSMVASICQ